MTNMKVHIRFPEDKIKEPIIYQIGHEFKVVTNVRRADVRETTGLDGSRTDRGQQRKSNGPSRAFARRASSSIRSN